MPKTRKKRKEKSLEEEPLKLDQEALEQLKKNKERFKEDFYPRFQTNARNYLANKGVIIVGNDHKIPGFFKNSEGGGSGAVYTTLFDKKTGTTTEVCAESFIDSVAYELYQEEAAAKREQARRKFPTSVQPPIDFIQVLRTLVPKEVSSSPFSPQSAIVSAPEEEEEVLESGNINNLHP